MTRPILFGGTLPMGGKWSLSVRAGDPEFVLWGGGRDDTIKLPDGPFARFIGDPAIREHPSADADETIVIGTRRHLVVIDCSDEIALRLPRTQAPRKTPTKTGFRLPNLPKQMAGFEGALRAAMESILAEDAPRFAERMNQQFGILVSETGPISIGGWALRRQAGTWAASFDRHGYTLPRGEFVWFCLGSGQYATHSVGSGVRAVVAGTKKHLFLVDWETGAISRVRR